MDTLKQIEHILDVYVRPELHLHNGNIRVMDFTNGVLHVKLLGQCSCCPSAHFAVTQLIESEVIAKLPQVKGVQLFQQVDDSLLEQARVILNHK